VAYIRERMPKSIPIISNGNIITYDDAIQNLESTGSDGVMSAEGILDNPALFAGKNCEKLRTELALEYMDMVDRYGPVKMKSIIFHIRRICKDAFDRYQLLEDCMACTDKDAA
ncbi:Dus1l, partial [Symbiodinium microadriaticum]